MADFAGDALYVYNNVEYETYQRLIARSAWVEKITDYYDGISKFYTQHKLIIFAGGQTYYQIARKIIKNNKLLFLMLFRLVPLDNPQPATEIMK
jgi:hypothetical protein